jgi:diguanylate cyclase (GGDEF)-like protein
MDAISPGRDGATDRILVVHDQASVRLSLRAPLEAAGLAVLEAVDAAGALALTAVEPISLAVVGAGVRCAPGGRPLVQALRDERDPGLAILAVVGPGDEAGALAAADHGADDHLCTPVDRSDLVVRVRACLRGSRRRAGFEQAALRRIAVAVAREVSPVDLFDQVAHELARVHGAAGGAVVRFDDGEATFVGRWSRRADSWPPRELTVPLTSPLPSLEVARTGLTARADDFRAFAGAVPWVLDRDAFRGSVAAPVHVHDRLWGAVVVATDRDEPLPATTEARLGGFAELVSLAIGNAEARAELAWRAATDPLTGLVNRGVFEDRLAEEVARSRRHGRDLSLVVLDLDAFKQVNDLHGHVVGDEVLRETALRLASRAREGDVIGRLGGEEFGWLMPETDGMEAWQATERARAAMAGAPFPHVGRVTISGGICDLRRADNALDLYRRADVALYWAKRHGRDVVFLYSPEAMDAMSEEERAAELRRGQTFQSIRVLARSVDAKDPSTRRHSERVAAVAAAIGGALGWSRERAALLHEAGLVHDVGKIAVSDAVLFKPGRLTEVEMRKVRMHAALGAEMVSDVVTPEQATWIRAHHERWDGEGYPDRLAGESIPEGGRILHLADAWDVMTSRRPYIAPRTPAAALAECRRLAGVQFWEPALACLEELWASGGLDLELLERNAPLERI